MSFSSDSSSLASIGASVGIPSLNVADIPENIRNGNSKAQQAYAEGLAFEQVLVNQLTTQIANTMASGTLDSSTDSSGDSTASSGGGLLGGSDTSGYASLIPQALTSSIMSDGGLGMAEEFAQAIDPAINDPGNSSSPPSSATEGNGLSGAGS